MDKQIITAADIEEIIIDRIERQEYLPGEMISSERSLSQTYGVSRQTVRNAIEILVKRRYLTRIQGKGLNDKKAINH